MAEEHRDIVMPTGSLEWAVEYAKDLLDISEDLEADCKASVLLEYEDGGTIKIEVW